MKNGKKNYGGAGAGDDLMKRPSGGLGMSGGNSMASRMMEDDRSKLREREREERARQSMLIETDPRPAMPQFGAQKRLPVNASINSKLGEFSEAKHYLDSSIGITSSPSPAPLNRNSSNQAAAAAGGASAGASIPMRAPPSYPYGGASANRPPPQQQQQFSVPHQPSHYAKPMDKASYNGQRSGYVPSSMMNGNAASHMNGRSSQPASAASGSFLKPMAPPMHAPPQAHQTPSASNGIDVDNILMLMKSTIVEPLSAIEATPRVEITEQHSSKAHKYAGFPSFGLMGLKSNAMTSDHMPKGFASPISDLPPEPQLQTASMAMLPPAPLQPTSTTVLDDDLNLSEDSDDQDMHMRPPMSGGDSAAVLLQPIADDPPQTLNSHHVIEAMSPVNDNSSESGSESTSPDSSSEESNNGSTNAADTGTGNGDINWSLASFLSDTSSKHSAAVAAAPEAPSPKPTPIEPQHIKHEPLSSLMDDHHAASMPLFPPMKQRRASLSPLADMDMSSPSPEPDDDRRPPASTSSEPGDKEPALTTSPSPSPPGPSEAAPVAAAPPPVAGQCIESDEIESVLAHAKSFAAMKAISSLSDSDGPSPAGRPYADAPAPEYAVKKVTKKRRPKASKAAVAAASDSSDEEGFSSTNTASGQSSGSKKLAGKKEKKSRGRPRKQPTASDADAAIMLPPSKTKSKSSKSKSSRKEAKKSSASSSAIVKQPVVKSREIISTEDTSTSSDDDDAPAGPPKSLTAAGQLLPPPIGSPSLRAAASKQRQSPFVGALQPSPVRSPFAAAAASHSSPASGSSATTAAQRKRFPLTSDDDDGGPPDNEKARRRRKPAPQRRNSSSSSSSGPDGDDDDTRSNRSSSLTGPSPVRKATAVHQPGRPPIIHSDDDDDEDDEDAGKSDKNKNMTLHRLFVMSKSSDGGKGGKGGKSGAKGKGQVMIIDQSEEQQHHHHHHGHRDAAAHSSPAATGGQPTGTPPTRGAASSRTPSERTPSGRTPSSGSKSQHSPGVAVAKAVPTNSASNPSSAPAQQSSQHSVNNFSNTSLNTSSAATGGKKSSSSSHKSHATPNTNNTNDASTKVPTLSNSATHATSANLIPIMCRIELSRLVRVPARRPTASEALSALAAAASAAASAPVDRRRPSIGPTKKRSNGHFATPQAPSGAAAACSAGGAAASNAGATTVASSLAGEAADADARHRLNNPSYYSDADADRPIGRPTVPAAITPPKLKHEHPKAEPASTQPSPATSAVGEQPADQPPWHDRGGGGGSVSASPSPRTKPSPALIKRDPDAGEATPTALDSLRHLADGGQSGGSSGRMATPGNDALGTVDDFEQSQRRKRLSSMSSSPYKDKKRKLDEFHSSDHPPQPPPQLQPLSNSYSGPSTSSGNPSMLATNHNRFLSPSTSAAAMLTHHSAHLQPQQPNYASSPSMLRAADMSQVPCVYRSYFEPVDESVECNGNPTMLLYEAQTLKHDADAMRDHLTQAMKYLEAVLYFLLTGTALERSSKEDTAFTMFSETLNLIKCISSKLRNKHNSDTVQGTNHSKVVILSLRCQSLILLKLYKMRRHDVRECQRSISDYMTKQGSKMANGKTPSALSPAQSGCPQQFRPVEQASGSSSGAATPPCQSVSSQMHSVFNRQNEFFNYLISCHELWDQADGLVYKGQHTEFFIALDRQYGPITLHSSLPTVVTYVKAGLQKLKSDRNPQ